jgi:hypothetical protein
VRRPFRAGIGRKSRPLADRHGAGNGFGTVPVVRGV